MNWIKIRKKTDMFFTVGYVLLTYNSILASVCNLYWNEIILFGQTFEKKKITNLKKVNSDFLGWNSNNKKNY